MTPTQVRSPKPNADGDIELSTNSAREVFARIQSPDYRRFAAQISSTGGCSRPVRIIDSSTSVDTATGDVTGEYSSMLEPDGVTYVRCGNRRASECASCSAEYKGDVWHLLVAGTTGGKGVPESVREHPLVFATLTAPSFGPVHSCVKPGRKPRRCRPRATKEVCPHGRPTWCMNLHGADDDKVGQPLCADCYAYTDQVIWQWWVPELWRRFTIAMRRELARSLGMSDAACKRTLRLEFAKVVEYQRRGVVHVHFLARLDGVATPDDQYPAPPIDVPAEAVCDVIRAAARHAAFPTPADGDSFPASVLQFGSQVDVRVVHDQAMRDDNQTGALHPETVAAYIAKYASTAADDLDPGDATVTNPHLRRIRATVDHLAGKANKADGAPYQLLERWVHMLGFRGHFSSKSRGFSTTLGTLREARRTWRTEHDPDVPTLPTETVAEAANEATTLVVGSWRFVGMGWLTNGDAALAAETAGRARERRISKASDRAA